MMSLERNLRKLSSRAVAAFAARCAMRVRPLFQHPDARQQYAVDEAIRVACEYASGNEILNTNAAKAAKAAAASTNAAASAAAYAAETVAYAKNKNGCAAYAKTAYVAANAAAHAAEKNAYAQTDRASLVDLDVLLQLKVEKVDPSETGPLGPLWPDEKPDWFRKVAHIAVAGQSEIGQFEVGQFEVVMSTQPVSVYFDVAEFNDEEIAGILGGFSDLYHALSGDVLVINKTETLDFSRVLVPEGV